MKKIIEHLKENWIRHGFETLVVTFGILGAFALNNWNEQRKDRVTEQQYLERLLFDIQKDSIYYENQILIFERTISHLDSFLMEMHNSPENSDDIIRIRSHFSFNTDDLTLKNSTFQELTSTGNMNILSNQSLRIAVMDYYQMCDDLASQIKEFNQFSTNVMTNAIMTVPILALVRGGNRNDLLLELFKDSSSHNFLTVSSTVSMYKSRNEEHLRQFIKLRDGTTSLGNQIQKALAK